MEYRKIGKTGISASVIGLGGEGLARNAPAEAERVIEAAMEAGINILDCFMPGKEIRSTIGKAIKGRRKDMLIQGHICSTDIHEQNDVSRDLAVCKKYFESYLADMGTDYIDFGMFFFVDTPADFSQVFEGDLLAYAQNLKKRGIIRAIGASCHNSETAARIVETGVVDLIMFSVNPVFDMTPAASDIYELLDDAKLKENYSLQIEPSRARLYRLCAQKQVSITVMKTLLAGKLLSASLSPFGKAMTAGQCIHYALTRPAVASVLIGCETGAEVREAVSYLDLKEEEKDYSAFLKEYQGKFKGNCVYCNHCQPCPSLIDVAAVTRYLDIAELNERSIPPTIIQHYRALKQHASACTGCGNCEKRCPFTVPVIRNMQKAEQVFGI
ncbi:MAG: aldo/keto reductase [Treponema sp.]|jgi:predicted aldo/keto reductase-like oxidoreductase|nr:aldo/keto reductase [Treponema sp.]